MSQEDKDMYWTAAGEIGATVFGIVVAILVYRQLPNLGGFPRWIATIGALLVSFKTVNIFVHRGYEDDKEILD